MEHNEKDPREAENNVALKSDSPERNSDGLEETKEIDLVKASDIVRDYFIKRYEPWIFFFQINSITKNGEERVYVVKCSYFPAQGGYEKNHFSVRVNVETGEIKDLNGFSENIKTGEKKDLEITP